MNRTKLLLFVFCFFQIFFLSAMVNTSETASSKDTIQGVSKKSSAKIFVVEGTVISSNIKEYTSAEIVEIDRVSLQKKVVKSSSTIDNLKVKVKSTKKIINKEVIKVKPALEVKMTWLPKTSTKLSSTIGYVNQATVPSVNYSKAFLQTIKFVKTPQVISFKEAKNKVELNEIIIFSDFSQSTRVRPPPFNS